MTIVDTDYAVTRQTLATAVAACLRIAGMTCEAADCAALATTEVETPGNGFLACTACAADAEDILADL